MSTLLLIVASLVGAACSYLAFRGFPTGQGREVARKRLRQARLAGVGGIVPVPFWLAHWIGTGQWFPGLLVIGSLGSFALLLAMIYVSHPEGTFGDVVDLRRGEPRFSAMHYRHASLLPGDPGPLPTIAPSGPTSAPGFTRLGLDDPVRLPTWLVVPELQARLAAFSSYADHTERRAMADTMAGILRLMDNQVGPACTAWRRGGVVYVSTLPGGYIEARTVELSVRARHGRDHRRC